MDLNKKGIVIPPYWVHLLIAVCCLAFTYWYCACISTLAHYELVQIRFLRFVGFMLLVEGLTHFSLHPKGIWVRFLWIPIRWISWDNVSDAQFLREWTTTGNSFTKMNGQGIIVTLAGCEPFYPDFHGLNLFLLKHPIRSFFIRFTPKNKALYVETFKQFFPDMSSQFPEAAE